MSAQGMTQTMGSMSQSLAFGEPIGRQATSGASGERGPGPSRGAGASHAWVEVYTPTHGWRGFDPTNNLLASTHHVKMGIGRDYNDVPPTRGTFRGLAEEKLDVEVVATVLES
jgi:transglutaminase-like putative cysteine protease